MSGDVLRQRAWEIAEAGGGGDRWGHRYSPPSRNNGTARETVWSEVHHNPSTAEGS
ncbi:hypothetical protein [Kitasatospora sp. NPDC004272]